jgi:hypothetical protein
LRFRCLARLLGGQAHFVSWERTRLGQDPPQLVALERLVLQEARGHPAQRFAMREASAQ